MPKMPKQGMAMAVSIGSPLNVGTGPDTILVDLSEDAYLGDAQFNLRVDGVQVGANQTVTASHALGQQQSFLLNGSFGAGPHVVTVGYFNDAYGGTPGLDRNLWLTRVYSGGVDYITDDVPLFIARSQSQTVNVPPGPVSVGTGADSFTLSLAEDAYQGDAQFTISVNGVQVGGVLTASSLRSSGQDQNFVVNGTFGFGPLNVTVNFLNDAYGGNSASDRNLYVDTVNRGGAISTVNQSMFFGGPLSFAVGAAVGTGAIDLGTGPDSILVGVSEDAYQGDAQFNIVVNGAVFVGTQTVSSSHALSQTTLYRVHGDFGPGTKSVHLQFLNDLYGGSSSTDRNVWLDSTTYAGVTTNWNWPIFSSDSTTFQLPLPAEMVSGSNISASQGFSVLTGTSGDDMIVSHGGRNTIYGNGGNDTVTGSIEGSDTVVVGRFLDRLVNFKDMVTINGAQNHVNSGDADVTIIGQASQTVARLGAGNNTVDLQGAGNVLEVGDGHNIISMTGGSATIRAVGPVTDAPPFSNTVTFSGDHNSFSAGISEGKYPAASNVVITGGTGFGTFNLGWGTGSLVTDGPGNTVTFGLGTHEVSPGSGNDTVVVSGFPGMPVGTIHLQGTGNIVRATGAQLTVTGGVGGSTITLDNTIITPSGQSVIQTEGPGNVVTQIGGNAIIGPGNGGDTVNIFGGQSNVVFSGADNMMFLHPGLPGTSSAGPAGVATLDQSTGLQVFIDPGFGSWAVSGFDPTGVVHLLGGFGGFTTPDQVAAALHNDGKGYASLAAGSDFIDFAGGPFPTAANFAIG
jgi:hypothetical protein